jgi:hypothetical protein
MVAKKIGKTKRISCKEAIMKYYILAEEDENVGQLLVRNGKYRHGIYFLIQSMEKYLRANIYMIIDPCDKRVVNQNRNHSVDEAVELLLNILSGDDLVTQQIKDQLEKVLGNIKYHHLHNNLRYPSFNPREKLYFTLDVNEIDAQNIIKTLELLKDFLKDFHKIQMK